MSAANDLVAQFNVNWGSMTMGSFLDQDECSIVQRYQQMSEAEINESVNREPDSAKELGQALVRLVRVTGNSTGVGLACALSAIVLAGGGYDRAALFVTPEGTLPVQEFVRVLSLEGIEGAQLASSKVIGAFLSAGSPSQLAGFAFEPLLTWLNGLIHIGAAVVAHNVVGLRAAGALFRSREFRLRFIATDGVQTLCDYLAHKTTEGLSTEVIYRATFCTWTLSYHAEAVPALCRASIVTHIINNNLPHIDDKISRLGLSILVNLLNQEDSEGVSLNDVMVESNIMKAIFDLSVRKWTAKDLKDVESDIAKLNKALSSKFSALNSFDRYMAELTTGALKPGPMHTDKFFSENASRFEHKDFVAVRLLVELLESEHEPSVVLACNDLGEFARFYDGGKKIIQHFKGKSKIMALMGHKTSREIQKAALMASAKLLITNWEHV